MHRKIIHSLIFLIFLIFLKSCCSHIEKVRKYSSVTLYKQSTRATGADLNFDQEYFWKDNKDNHTFITQSFSLLQYDSIISKVRKMKFIDNTKPKYYPYINYAFVVNKVKPEIADTIYYDGFEKWWILSKGNYSMYKDEKNELSDMLRKLYPIFRNCSYSPQDN